MHAPQGVVQPVSDSGITCAYDASLAGGSSPFHFTSAIQGAQPITCASCMGLGYHWPPSLAEAGQAAFSSGSNLVRDVSNHGGLGIGLLWPPSPAETGQAAFTSDSNLVSDVTNPDIGPVWSSPSAALDTNGGAFNFHPSAFGTANIAGADYLAGDTGAIQPTALVGYEHGSATIATEGHAWSSSMTAHMPFPQTPLVPLVPPIGSGDSASSQLHQPFEVESGCVGAG